MEHTRNFGFTGWTDVREVEYVGAMDPEAEASVYTPDEPTIGSW